MDTSKNSISRRGILKSLGFAGAAVVSTPIIGSAAESFAKATSALTGSASTTVSGTPTIGLLVPKGNARVGVASLLEGFELYCNEYQAEHGSLPFRIITEEVGVSGVSASRAMHKLIQQHHVTMAVGMLNSRVTRQVTAHLGEANVPFLEINHGENFFHKDLANECVFQNSLNLWQSNYVLGKYAAEHLGREAVSVASLVDSAFDAHYAFKAGFVAGGGTVVSTIITGSPADRISPFEAASKAAASSAPVVFCNYSGHDGALFLSQLQQCSNGTKQVVASRLVSQPALQTYFGNNGTGVITAHTWQGSLTESSFNQAYRSAYGIEPKEEAVLGYDTAKMLCSVLSASGSGTSTTGVMSALKQAAITSVRGEIAMNTHSQAMEAPVSIYKVGALGEAHTLLSVISIPEELRADDFRLCADVRSGSIATYPHM